MLISIATLAILPFSSAVGYSAHPSRLVRYSLTVTNQATSPGPCGLRLSAEGRRVGAAHHPGLSLPGPGGASMARTSNYDGRKHPPPYPRTPDERATWVP